jgi:co-chaperonin GroES (HSP10)
MRPTGYYVLIEMEEVSQVSEGGIIMSTGTEHDREQNGHDVGVVISFGPTCFMGFKGISEELDLEDRCLAYGVSVGEKVEFNRYDGKIPRDPSFSNCRLIQDEHIVGVYQ